jgi:N-acetylglucosamine-6-phosphate deacetylase
MRPADRARSTEGVFGSAFAISGRLVGFAAGPGAAGERDGTVTVHDGKIAALAPLAAEPPASRGQGGGDAIAGAPIVPRLRAAYVAPGFVDLQVNGAFGHEVGADPRALRALAAALPATGVTAFLPTLVSRPEADYAGCFAALDEEQAAAGHGERAGSARILGLHLEGPLLAPARAGAHARGAIDAATASTVDRLADPTRVRLVTLAPERDGALELIGALRARGIAVSLGHTDATFETFTAGVDAGARFATHVWNAMSPLHHRAPGATGAALSDDRITALAIADGVHTHPAVFRLTARAKGTQRLALVTDAIAAAGLGSGASALAGRPVTVDATSARLADGTLAGSTLTLDRAVRNAMQFASLSIAEAVEMAAGTPRAALLAASSGHPGDRPGDGARALGPGAPADLVLLDADFSVRATFVGGRLAYVKDGDVDALRA